MIKVEGLLVVIYKHSGKRSYYGNTTRPKKIVTVQEIAISNMLEIEALRQLLFEKGIIGEEEFIERYKKLDREMKDKRER